MYSDSLIIQSIALLCCQMCTVWVANKYPHLRKDINYLFSCGYIRIIIVIFGYCIMTPLLEEALFRVVLKQFLNNILKNMNFFSPNQQQSIVVAANAIIFGLAHVQNFTISGQKGKNLLLLQIFCTFYLGLYLSQFDNYITVFLIHGYYNLSNLIFILIVLKRQNVHSEPKMTEMGGYTKLFVSTQSKDDIGIRLGVINESRQLIRFKCISRSRLPQSIAVLYCNDVNKKLFRKLFR